METFNSIVRSSSRKGNKLIFEFLLTDVACAGYRKDLKKQLEEKNDEGKMKAVFVRPLPTKNSDFINQFSVFLYQMHYVTDEEESFERFINDFDCELTHLPTRK